MHQMASYMSRMEQQNHDLVKQNHANGQAILHVS